jgi:hypothetical protein
VQRRAHHQRSRRHQRVNHVIVRRKLVFPAGEEPQPRRPPGGKTPCEALRGGIETESSRQRQHTALRAGASSILLF